jgi:hypothetical protein
MVTIEIQMTILSGVVAGLLAWAWSRHVGVDQAALIRWALAASVGAFILGAVLALLAGRTFVQEFAARKSYLSLALFLFSGACVLVIFNVFNRARGDDDA